MFLKPVNEFGAAHATGGEFEHKALLFVHRSVDVASVHQEEGHHRSVRHALMSVHVERPFDFLYSPRIGAHNASTDSPTPSCRNLGR